MTPRPPVRLVIFDCDGVLVDSEVISARVLADELIRLGLPLSPADCIDRFTGISMASLRDALIAEFDRTLPEDFLDRLAAADRAAFARTLQPIPGVAAAIGQIDARRCVASSGSIDKMRFTLGHTGLLTLFEPHLFSASMVARGKPAPDLFLFAAAEMDASVADCLVIEDSIAGVTAARDAGMRVLGFAGGAHCGAGHEGHLRQAGATDVFADMAHLPRLIAGDGSALPTFYA